MRGGVVPGVEHLVAAGGRQQGQPRGRAFRFGGHAFQEDGQVLGHPCGGGGVEQLGVVADAQGQFGPGVRHQAERVVGGLDAVEPAQPKAVGGGEIVVDGIVLEDHDAVEQGGALGEFGERLHPCQRRVVEAAVLALVALEVAQPVEQGAVARHGDPGGQGGDEQAGHVLGAGQLGRPSGDGGAEDDVRPAGLSAQEQCPRALDEGVDGESRRPREGFERPAGGLGHGGADRVRGLGVVALARLAVVGQRGGLAQAGEAVLPVAFGLRPVAVAQPGHVVAVRTPVGQATAGSGHIGEVGVPGEHVGQDVEQAPAVEDQVVEGPHHAHGGVGEPGEGQALERGRRQVDAALAVLVEEVPQPGPPLVLAEAAPVEVGDGDGRAPPHHEERFGDVLPHDVAAEHRGTVRDLLPGRRERLGVGHAVQDERQLLEVDAAVVLRQAVEEHARLGGRERMDVLHRAGVVSGDPVHGRLVEPGQREVRRGAPAGAGGGGVPGDAAQRVGEPPGEVGDGGLLVQFGGVEPGELQLFAVQLAHDLQGVGAGGERIGVQLQRAERVAVQAVGRAGDPEPAQVVEADLRGGRRRQHSGPGQVPQAVVPQAVPRHRAHLLLDLLEYGVPARVGRDGEGDGVTGGEPADGTAGVDVGEELLAAVSLDVHEHALVSGPRAQHPAEGAQQHVVDPGAVGVRQRAQQGGGVLGAQAYGDRARRGVGVGAGQVPRQVRLGAGGGPCPVRRLVVEAALGGVGGQAPGPVPQRRGLGGQRPGPAAALAAGAVRPVEVLQQDAPGDAVDDEVVDGQVQDRGQALAPVVQDGAQQRTAGQVEGAEVGCVGVGAGVVAEAQARHALVDVPAGGARLPVGAARLPVGAGEAGTQCVVVGDDVVEGLLQGRRVDGACQLRGQGLREVARPFARAVEQPALDGRQGCRAGGGHDGRGRGSAGAGVVRAAGEGGDRLVPVDVTGGHREPGLPGLGDHLDAEDGVAAEGEEVVVGADPLHVQHVGPDSGEYPLGGGAGRDVAGGVPGGRRRREAAAVQLAVGVQRQRGQHHDGRGDQVVGQGAAECPAHRLRF
ncbi:putative Linear gramicidin synthase subunit C [Streptomyces aurantiacus JA 4570]|uniref:Putative Linear gramicidin synthase subunit C n=1 Tax=Streptomyces aurantiacus JA 4570 TaxID=1286094 RepID=S3ZMA2_9ACTN|nr:putative Linear gramicidin synthase subunit C [Streptomyces aurantiacus JA 4570]